MRRIRENTPHKTWFVTSRILESRFFLKPDPDAVEVMGFVLARALRMFPSIRLRAYVFLSNHLHLVLTDERGELSAFCQQLFGNLAREVNELRGREGTVFPRRFSSEEIVDDEAFADRVVYTLLNPADARLVNRYDEWPELIGWQLHNARREVKRFNRRAYAIAPRRAWPRAPPRGVHRDRGVGGRAFACTHRR